MEWPKPFEKALQPLFDALPLELAMPELVVSRPPRPEDIHVMEVFLEDPKLQDKPLLAAGLWLYIDDLEHSHKISKEMTHASGAFWHGIMHRREGDFSNSKHWLSQVGQHPALPLIPDYDPVAFIDAVAAAQPGNPEELLAKQRHEWLGLMRWCANQYEF